MRAVADPYHYLNQSGSSPVPGLRKTPEVVGSPATSNSTSPFTKDSLRVKGQPHPSTSAWPLDLKVQGPFPGERLLGLCISAIGFTSACFTGPNLRDSLGGGFVHRWPSLKQLCAWRLIPSGHLALSCALCEIFHFLSGWGSLPGHSAFASSIMHVTCLWQLIILSCYYSVVETKILQIPILNLSILIDFGLLWTL